MCNVELVSLAVINPPLENLAAKARAKRTVNIGLTFINQVARNTISNEYNNS